MSTKAHTEQPCRLCARYTDRADRICARCDDAVRLHRSTIAPAIGGPPLTDQEALSRLIVQRERAWFSANLYPDTYSPDLAVVVVELERPGERSAFMIWENGDFRRIGQRLTDLIASSADFANCRIHLHDGTELFSERHGPSTRHQYRGAIAAPATVAAWQWPGGGVAACAIRVDHESGTHPADTLGQAAWDRLSGALDSCGVSIDGRGLAVRFGPGPAPVYGDAEPAPHPADLAVAVALLIDAEAVDPAIAEDAALCAALAWDGTLLPVPFGRTEIARWAVEHAWPRLHLVDLDIPAVANTGLALWGYGHLRDLVDAWRPGPGVKLVQPGQNGDESP